MISNMYFMCFRFFSLKKESLGIFLSGIVRDLFRAYSLNLCSCDGYLELEISYSRNTL
jgi:hypothetical protein